MLNIIWLIMILVAVVVGGFSGQLPSLVTVAFETAQNAVMKTALPLVGLWALWLGMMRLIERAGLVAIIARALRPIMRRLFPEVPAEHPAMGAMVLNMSANMLGLGNATTPLGLRAMKLLQKLNPAPSVASNSMVTFLTINTASIQLVPTTAISILAAAGAKNAPSIVVPAFIASAVAMACGIFVARVLAPFYPVQKEAAGQAEVAEPVGEEDIAALPEAPPLSRAGRSLLWVFVFVFAVILVVLVWPAAANRLPEFFGWSWRYGNTWPAESGGQRFFTAVSLLTVPFFLAFFPLYAHLRKVKVYEEFCEGAKEAFPTAQRVIPFLVGMLVAIKMLDASGAMPAIKALLRAPLAALHFPVELLPLTLMRPLSGGASQGLFIDLANTLGGDDILSKMAAIIYGSTETTFYVLAVYFGSVAVKKTRHAIIAGLTADIVAVIVTIAVCRMMLS